MDPSVTSRGNRSHFILRTAFIVAVALIVTAVLMAQGEDAAQIRARAMALEQKGLNAEAEQIWDSIAKADPRDAEALAHLGLMEARQERLEVAIGYYRRALAVNPDFPSLRMNLGLALFKAAQFPDAIRMFTSELTKHPGDPRLTILLGMAHYGMNDYLVAIPYLQRAAQRDVQSVPLRMTLAHSCMSSKQYQCVLSVHKEMLALNAESAEADMLAGEALDRMGHKAGAIEQFRAAILKNPQEPSAHFGLGYLLWTQGNWTEAANEFRLELQNVPQHVRARMYLADSLVRQTEFAQALTELDKLSADEHSDSLVHRDLGIIYANSNRGTDAVRELEMAVKLDPRDEDSHLQLAKAYKAIGREDDASTELAKAKQLTPRSHQPLEEMIDFAEVP
jgi:tetratricopeptide (TPR) repeat protein